MAHTLNWLREEPISTECGLVRAGSTGGDRGMAGNFIDSILLKERRLSGKAGISDS